MGLTPDGRWLWWREPRAGYRRFQYGRIDLDRKGSLEFLETCSDDEGIKASLTADGQWLIHGHYRPIHVHPWIAGADGDYAEHGNAHWVWPLPSGEGFVQQADNGELQLQVAGRPEGALHLGQADLARNPRFSRDGAWLAAISSGRTINVWNVQRDGADLCGGDRPPRWKLGGHQAQVNDVAFSYDSRLLVSTSDDHTTRLWSLTDGGQVAAFHLPARGAGCAVMSTGRVIVGTTEGGVLFLDLIA